jgi:hypothetical protein
MNKLIEAGKTIYICFENPKNHTFLIHDGNKNFSIMTKEEIEDNKEGYIFKQDEILNSQIRCLIRNNFDLNELMVFLPVMIELNFKFYED